MSAELSEFMSEHRKDSSQMEVETLKELIETNMMILQDYFNSLFQVYIFFSYEYSINTLK